MESKSVISKFSKYKQLYNQSDLDDFIDFLLSQKIINETHYYNIHAKKNPQSELFEIFEILELKDEDTVEKIQLHLDNLYPNNQKLLDDEYNFRKTSVRGGFPKLPPNYVTRTSLVEDLRSKLLSLQWDTKLIVHGMMGYGKSCLVNEVLNEPGIRKYFDNLLFWINLGEHGSKETVLKPLWRLYSTVSGIIHKKISHCPDDVQILKDLLTELFLDPKLEKALIILDDACNEEVLSLFNIRCRTIITTQNKNILPKEESMFIEVKTGFSRTESLELFKKSLNVHKDLPAEAEEIHEICKGHPMLVALIGSYLRENSELAVNNDIEIWEFIKFKFLRGNYKLNEYDTHSEVPTEKIKNCVETLLANGLKEYYLDLAIFLADVNIPPEVLQILWNEERFEVLNKMNKLAEKSLVVPFYHNDLRTYIYGIHDIYLNYLKDVTKERTVSLHKKLISGYDRITQGNYANLPNDNYTLQFIGYHLYHAEAFRKFDIYFNLKFLEAKIKAVGKEDVLRDMRKYELYITKNDNILKEKLEQYKNFVSRCGSSLYSYEKTDIIQFALREKKESVVFKDALLLAENSPNLYFKLQRPVDDLEFPTRSINADMTCACFVDSPQHILIGTANGTIKLFYEENEKEISSFVGHAGYIKNLIVSPDKRYFLSVSIDGTVILWKFAPDSARNSHDFTNKLPVSPKTKQKRWQDMFTPDRGKIKPTRQFQSNEPDSIIVSATFCDNFPETYRIATGGSRGDVIIWDAYSGEKICNTGNRGISVSCVIYQENKLFNRVIFACDDTILVYQLNSNKLVYEKSFHNQGAVCESVFISGNKIFAISDTNITFWDERMKPHRSFEKSNGKKSHICSTITDDLNYLIVSTDKSTVYIWNIEENKIVKELKTKGLAISLDTFYDEDKSVHIILIASDRKTLQQCQILPNENEPHMAIIPRFFPFWKRKHPLTALVNKDNQTQVFNGYVQFSETEIIDSPVTCTCFSSCGNNVVYGLQNGEVHIFNLRSKKSLCLENEENIDRGPVTYLYCHKPSIIRNKSVSSCESGDSLDFNFYFEGIIISVNNNNLITVYNNDTTKSMQIDKPLIYYQEEKMVIVDSKCKIYIWNLTTNSCILLNNPSIFEEVTVCKATYCCEKSLLAVVYKQMTYFFLDVYNLIEDVQLANQVKRIELEEKIKSCCFSSDGSLLALGTSSGDIKVWNLKDKYKSTTLTLHNCPVEDLLFSPSIEPPILVSLGEYIAWWNLKTFQEIPRRSPRSLEILKNISDDLSAMNISHWADRKYVEGTEYLLSCMRLNGCAKYLSASKDFNTFLTVDDKGKIYVMEIID